MRSNLAEGLLLSGGLDTSILAFILSKHRKGPAITVAFEEAKAPDLEYASLVVKRLGLEYCLHVFERDELFEALRQVIVILRSYDPMEIRNSVSIFLGLRTARALGLKSVMTGDGADELYAGYSFFFDMGREELKAYLKRVWEIMDFSSHRIGKHLEVDVKEPYLEPRFKAFSMKLDPALKVRAEGGQTYGKWVLRKAFEGLLPDEILWREKMAIEFGSGTTLLPTLLNEMISDVDFEEDRKKYHEEDGVVIRDKEHSFYYDIFRSEVGVPRPDDPSARTCPQCTSNLPKGVTFCRVCGAFPV